MAFLDSDCIAEPDWLEELLAGFAAEPGCRILGGAVRIFAADPGRPNLAEAFDLVYGIRQEWTIARHGYAATANLAVRREVFAAVGGFAGLSISEDMEWGKRAKVGGFPTRFVPQAIVRHPARRSMADLRRQWDRHVSHHWSMQPKTVRGRAAWALHAGCARRLAAGRDPAHPGERPGRRPAPAPRRLPGARGDSPLPGAAHARRARGPRRAAAQRPLEPLA